MRLSLFSSLWLLLLGLCQPVLAQKDMFLPQAEQYLHAHAAQWGLTADDLSQMSLRRSYVSKKSGARHFYFKQQAAGIEVHNAITAVHLHADGRFAFATNRFIPQLGSRIQLTQPVVTLEAAIAIAADALGYTANEAIRVLPLPEAHHWQVLESGFAKSPIRVALNYLPVGSHFLASGQMQDLKSVNLAWRLQIDLADHYWELFVDAANGEILKRTDMVLRCSASGSHQHGRHCVEELAVAPPAPADTDGASYHVWSHLVESPIYGDRSLIVDPADEEASPYGWHDTDGQAGAEYTTTRGNNVHAYLDLLDDDLSLGDEPDGGSELVFDYPFSEALEPEDYQELSVTQLFYMNNFMHDFSYAYGFDEVAGNFQVNNYGNGGEDGDPVLAESQNGPATNDANFTVLPDGFPARMQMFRWNIQGGRLITVNEPELIAGAYEGGTALFGPPLTATPVTGTVVAAYDNSPTGASRLCNEAANPDEIAGKVALVDRGVCPFQQKTINAEAAGAIAVIICNFEEQANILGDNSSVAEPTIPTISMKFSDCQKIRDLIAEGVEVSLQLPNDEGPAFRDGALDNGVVAHEYAHGISVRLTGGADDETCLFNDEQMGEGWSDFFTLVTTVTAEDAGTDPRGIGNYISGGNIQSSGTRRRPYSTDPAINSYTYADIIGTNGPHALGEVWASMLWDIYWAMVDVHGFDEDLLHGNKGNNMAVQLVMDGMKLQACSPGFVDGRDAILKADTLLYDGANACLLWDVFAKRGLGWEADQGSSDDRHDLIEDFQAYPGCTPTVKINKRVTEYLNPGETIKVTLHIRNDKTESVTGLVITDQLAEGLVPDLSSVEGADDAMISGDVLVLSLPDLAAGTQTSITYDLLSDPQLGSTRVFFDDMESGDDNWIFNNLTGIEVWDLSTANPFGGTWSWYVKNSGLENDQVLELVEPLEIMGDFPVVRFMHDYDTESGEDGGLVELSTDGVAWQPLGDRLFGKRYQGPLAYSTFAIPNLDVFMGDSEGYVASYIDLRDFVGQEVYLRWRYGTDEENNEFDPNIGWFLDDVEYLDLFYYQTEACLSTDQGDSDCSTPEDWGTKVSSDIMTSTDAPSLLEGQLSLYPNPAEAEVIVQVQNQVSGTVGVELLALDGRLLQQAQFELSGESGAWPLSLEGVAPGMYFVSVQINGQTAVTKLVVK